MALRADLGFAGVEEGMSMALDMSVDLISATVQLEQPIGGGVRTVGTGFLISDPAPDGTPRVVLATAQQVGRVELTVAGRPAHARQNRGSLHFKSGH